VEPERLCDAAPAFWAPARAQMFKVNRFIKKTSQTLAGSYTFSIYIFNNFNHEDSKEEKNFFSSYKC
jgi:hypothetical protein